MRPTAYSLVITIFFVLQAATEVCCQNSWQIINVFPIRNLHITNIHAAPVVAKPSIFLKHPSAKPNLHQHSVFSTYQLDENSFANIQNEISNSNADSCDDIPPDDTYTCQEQATWGKCSEQWMAQGNFCAKTCARCTVGGQDDCKTVYQVGIDNGELSIFVQAVQSAGFVDLFNNIEFEATVFAPTNAAFEALAQTLGSSVQVILDDINLPMVLMYHVITAQKLYKSSLFNRQVLSSGLQGQSLTVNLGETNGEVFQIESVGSVGNVIRSNIVACEAVVHMLDQVLLPNFDLIQF